MTEIEKNNANEDLTAFVESVKLESIEEGPNRARVVLEADYTWSDHGNHRSKRSVRIIGRVYGQSKKLSTKWVDAPEDRDYELILKHTIVLVIRDVLDVINKEKRPTTVSADLTLGDE